MKRSCWNLGTRWSLFELNAGKLMHGGANGNLIYTSGQVSRWGDREIKGKVGGDLSVEQGYEAALFSTLSCLRAIKTLAGSLDNVVQVVKVLGMVNVDPSFDNTPGVIHGCSDLLLEVFGVAGRHARSAVGMTIPMNYAVEVEMDCRSAPWLGCSKERYLDVRAFHRSATPTPRRSHRHRRQGSRSYDWHCIAIIRLST